MNIEAFLLCDAATDQQRKLNILGAFDVIWAKQLPVKHPACSIVTRIRFDNIEDGDHSIRIHIIDQDGKAIGPTPEGKISVRTGKGFDSSAANLILNLFGLEFEQYGKYRIDLAIDENIQASLPLWVNETPSQAQSPR